MKPTVSYGFVEKLTFRGFARANQGIVGCVCGLWYDVVALVLFLTIGIFKVFSLIYRVPG